MYSSLYNHIRSAWEPLFVWLFLESYWPLTRRTVKPEHTIIPQHSISSVGQQHSPLDSGNMISKLTRLPKQPAGINWFIQVIIARRHLAFDIQNVSPQRLTLCSGFHHTPGRGEPDQIAEPSLDWTVKSSPSVFRRYRWVLLVLPPSFSLISFFTP